MIYGKIELQESRENDNTVNDEVSSNAYMAWFAFDFCPDAILIGYPRYTEYNGCLQRHRNPKSWRVAILLVDEIHGKFNFPASKSR